MNSSKFFLTLLQHLLGCIEKKFFSLDSCILLKIFIKVA